MDVSALTGLTADSWNERITNGKVNAAADSFDNMLAAAMNMVNETNDFQNAAESEEIRFALGESTSTHELLIAQEKANVALQFTVAVRDKVLEAYREIMNMQI